MSRHLSWVWFASVRFTCLGTAQNVSVQKQVTRALAVVCLSEFSGCGLQAKMETDVLPAQQTVQKWPARKIGTCRTPTLNGATSGSFNRVCCYAVFQPAWPLHSLLYYQSSQASSASYLVIFAPHQNLLVQHENHQEWACLKHHSLNINAFFEKLWHFVFFEPGVAKRYGMANHWF